MLVDNPLVIPSPLCKPQFQLQVERDSEGNAVSVRAGSRRAFSSSLSPPRERNSGSGDNQWVAWCAGEASVSNINAKFDNVNITQYVFRFQAVPRSQAECVTLSS